MDSTDAGRVGAAARDGAARLGGGLLAAATTALSRARSTAKPLHPRGEVWTARLTASPGVTQHPDTAWLADVLDERVEVRISTAIGLRPGWPDISGVAVRLPLADRPVRGQHIALRHVDLLFASTGTGPLTRFLLAPTRHPDRHRLSTLLPYRGSAGPILFALRPVGRTATGHREYEMARAHGTGDWLPCGRLRLNQPAHRSLDFDPIGNTAPGLDQYPWVRQLRSPAYRTARRERESR